MATTNDANKLKDIVSANSVNICPIRPDKKRTGTNTAIVVKVEAVIAPATSFVPILAASFGVFPKPKCRSIFSITTMDPQASLYQELMRLTS